MNKYEDIPILERLERIHKKIEHLKQIGVIEAKTNVLVTRRTN